MFIAFSIIILSRWHRYKEESIFFLVVRHIKVLLNITLWFGFMTRCFDTSCMSNFGLICSATFSVKEVKILYRYKMSKTRTGISHLNIRLLFLVWFTSDCLSLIDMLNSPIPPPPLIDLFSYTYNWSMRSEYVILRLANFSLLLYKLFPWVYPMRLLNFFTLNFWIWLHYKSVSIMVLLLLRPGWLFSFHLYTCDRWESYFWLISSLAIVQTSESDLCFHGLFRPMLIFRNDFVDRASLVWNY